MADAWTILFDNSTLGPGFDAWEHLNAQEGGTGPCDYIIHGDGIDVTLNDLVLTASINNDFMNVSISDSDILIASDNSEIATYIDQNDIVAQINVDSVIIAVDCIPSEGDVMIISKVAATQLDAYTVITTNSDGEIYACDRTAILAGKQVLGITSTDVEAGSICRIFVSDQEITNTDWVWDTDNVLYLADDGSITQTPSMNGFVITIGIPLSPNSMRVRVEPPIILET